MITSSTGRRRDLKRSVLKPVGRSLRRHREAGSSEMWSWRRVPSERSPQKELIVGHPQRKSRPGCAPGHRLSYEPPAPRPQRRHRIVYKGDIQRARRTYFTTSSKDADAVAGLPHRRSQCSACSIGPGLFRALCRSPGQSRWLSKP